MGNIIVTYDFLNPFRYRGEKDSIIGYWYIFKQSCEWMREKGRKKGKWNMIVRVSVWANLCDVCDIINFFLFFRTNHTSLADLTRYKSIWHIFFQLLDTLPVCQDFNRQVCNRPACKFIHLSDGELFGEHRPLIIAQLNAE